jgi:acetolactate synthase-1/2/3 large subunit
MFQFTTYGEAEVEFQDRDFEADVRACGADGYRVEPLEELKAAFAVAFPLGVSHHSPSPHCVTYGLMEMVEQGFRRE